MPDFSSIETQPYQVPTGIEGTNVPSDFSIPPCGIEDVDEALFRFLDKKIGFVVATENKTTKVPVIYAVGERFAMVKRRIPIRDKSGTLILPLVSIRRTGISQTDDVRGALRNTGDLIIKRRLSPSDRKYQQVINKGRLRNQDNVASPANFADSDLTPPRNGIPGRASSRRDEGTANIVTDPGQLREKLGKNIVEIITMPFPQYFIAKYEIVFWSQYTQHMNQMIEQMMTGYDDQGTVQANVARLDTDKGYWFVATFDKDITPDDNATDFAEEERIIRSVINVEVRGYVVASQAPGMPGQFRSFMSAPTVEFESKAVSTEIHNDFKSPVMTGDTGKFMLEEVDVQDIKGNDRRRRGSPNAELLIAEFDPITGKKTTRYVSTPVRGRRTGETVYRRALIEDLGNDVI